MKVDITLHPIYKDCAPIVKISTTQTHRVIEVPELNTYQVELDALPDDVLHVEFQNKSKLEDNWLMIKSIKLDGIDLQHFILRGKFYPAYDQDWYDQQDPKPPEFYCPGTHLRHAGVWRMPIRFPVFKTLLDFWCQDER